MARYTGLLGLITFLALAYAFSTDRRAIKWRTVVWGLGLQIVFAFGVIKWNFGQVLLKSVKASDLRNAITCAWLNKATKKLAVKLEGGKAR